MSKLIKSIHKRNLKSSKKKKKFKCFFYLFIIIQKSTRNKVAEVEETHYVWKLLWKLNAVCEVRKDFEPFRP